jgi:hypothetical protein
VGFLSSSPVRNGSGGTETSAGSGTSYNGESSETGVIETPTETPSDTPSDTPGGGDIAPQTESTGYSYSITPDGQLVLHSPDGRRTDAISCARVTGRSWNSTSETNMGGCGALRITS